MSFPCVFIFICLHVPPLVVHFLICGDGGLPVDYFANYSEDVCTAIVRTQTSTLAQIRKTINRYK